MCVSVAPSDPYIEGHENNSLITVSSTLQSMTLTCWCLTAKPPPAITWLHNDVTVTSATYRVTSSNVTGLWDAWSVVLVAGLRPELTGDVFTCRCVNEASSMYSEFTVRLHVSGQYTTTYITVL